MGSGPEIVTDTLFDKNLYLFCIHFGLRLSWTRQRRSKRVQSASKVLPNALGDASRAPILASRALQVLPDGVRNRLGSISDQILINDMASEPPESTNVLRIWPRSPLRLDEVIEDLASEPLRDDECIKYLASEPLQSSRFGLPSPPSPSKWRQEPSGLLSLIHI